MFYLLLGAMTVHVQLEILFVSETLATQLATQVLDRFKVRMTFTDVCP